MDVCVASLNMHFNCVTYYYNYKNVHFHTNSPLSLYFNSSEPCLLCPTLGRDILLSGDGVRLPSNRDMDIVRYDLVNLPLPLLLGVLFKRRVFLALECLGASSLLGRGPSFF